MCLVLTLVCFHDLLTSHLVSEELMATLIAQWLVELLNAYLDSKHLFLISSLRSITALSLRSGQGSLDPSRLWARGPQLFMCPSLLPFSFTDFSFPAACRIQTMSVATHGLQLVIPDACRSHLSSIAKVHSVCFADGFNKAYSTDVYNIEKVVRKMSSGKQPGLYSFSIFNICAAQYSFFTHTTFNFYKYENCTISWESDMDSRNHTL